MIVSTFNREDIEDPPSRWFDKVHGYFSKILEDQIFAKYKGKTQVSVVFIHDPAMKKLNLQYRGKNSTTDVLSFLLNEKLPEEYLLGEIVISIDKAKTDATTFGISLFQEVMLLLVHGVTHLLGYDHKNDLQETKMKEIENKLMNQISFSEGVEVHE